VLPCELGSLLVCPLLPLLPDEEERSRTMGGAIRSDRGLFSDELPRFVENRCQEPADVL